MPECNNHENSLQQRAEKIRAIQSRNIDIEIDEKKKKKTDVEDTETETVEVKEKTEKDEKVQEMVDQDKIIPVNIDKIESAILVEQEAIDDKKAKLKETQKRKEFTVEPEGEETVTIKIKNEKKKKDKTDVIYTKQKRVEEPKIEMQKQKNLIKRIKKKDKW